MYIFFLLQISQQRTNEMQNQIEFIYKAYFKDLQKKKKTALQIVNERVFSQHAKTYRSFFFRFIDLFTNLFQNMTQNC